jgi:hypothetical protein
VGVIDGRQWLERRLHTVEAALQDESLDAGRRSQLEAEAARLREEVRTARWGRALGALGGTGIAGAYRAWKNRRADHG